jgi:hypothetical protein
MADRGVMRETIAPACPRVKVKNPAPGVWTAGGARMPAKFAEALEQNQKLSSCCRHPENHEIEALFSNPDDCKGCPDIYIYHCTCGRQHRRFCVGGNPMRDGETDYAALAKIGREEEKRPFWE